MLEGIPEESAKMTLAMKNLLDLPEGAGYRNNDGRASVSVTRQGGEIVVTGRCDSLDRQMLLYEEELFRQWEKFDSLEDLLAISRRSLSLAKDSIASISTKTEKSGRRNWRDILSALLCGILAGMGLATLTKLKL